MLNLKYPPNHLKLAKKEINVETNENSRRSCIWIWVKVFINSRVTGAKNNKDSRNSGKVWGGKLISLRVKGVIPQWERRYDLNNQTAYQRA